VLDAARDTVLAVGVRRTTMTEVARRAGVSRMTLYRRWPDVGTLVADLMTREWLRAVAASEPPQLRTGPAMSGRDRVVAHVLAAGRAVRRHPLFRKIVEVDPDLLLPYLLRRRGTSQQVILQLMADRLRDGQADGSVRDADPGLLARTVLLVAQALVLSGRTLADRGGVGVLERQVATLLDRYLAP